MSNKLPTYLHNVGTQNARPPSTPVPCRRLPPARPSARPRAGTRNPSRGPTPPEVSKRLAPPPGGPPGSASMEAAAVAWRDGEQPERLYNARIVVVSRRRRSSAQTPPPIPSDHQPLSTKQRRAPGTPIVQKPHRTPALRMLDCGGAKSHSPPLATEAATPFAGPKTHLTFAVSVVCTCKPCPRQQHVRPVLVNRVNEPRLSDSF